MDLKMMTKLASSFHFNFKQNSVNQFQHSLAKPFRMLITNLGSNINNQDGRDSHVIVRVGTLVNGLRFG